MAQGKKTNVATTTSYPEPTLKLMTFGFGMIDTVRFITYAMIQNIMTSWSMGNSTPLSLVFCRTCVVLQVILLCISCIHEVIFCFPKKFHYYLSKQTLFRVILYAIQ